MSLEQKFVYLTLIKVDKFNHGTELLNEVIFNSYYFIYFSPPHKKKVVYTPDEPLKKNHS